jgi:hypothetical protein
VPIEELSFFTKWLILFGFGISILMIIIITETDASFWDDEDDE